MKNKTRILANLALVTQIGLTVALILIFFIFLGKVLDDKLGTKVVFLIIFTIIGVLSAFNYIFRIGISGAGKNRKTTVSYDKKETKKLSEENEHIQREKLREKEKRKEMYEKSKRLKEKRKEDNQNGVR